MNRKYEASRYQPTACRVINSPTYDNEIAKIVREVWQSDCPAQHLFASLLIDLFSKDDETRCGAAMRLMFYFPNESGSLISAVIRNLDLTQKRSERSDAQFISAVGMVDHPSVTAALFHVIRTTDSPALLRGALTVKTVERDPDGVYDRIHRKLVAAAEEDERLFERRNLLAKATKLYPIRSQELFAQLQDETLESVSSCWFALAESKKLQPWMVEFLTKLLGDQRETSAKYGTSSASYPIRICDKAAELLALRHLHNLDFRIEQNPSYMDGQINQLKRVLAGDSKAFVGSVEEAAVRHPKRVLTVSASLRNPISNDETIWAGALADTSGEHTFLTLKINGQTGSIEQQIKIDQWHGSANLLPHGPGSHLYAYHGYEGGHIFIRDVRSGSIARRIDTPFQDGIDLKDKLQVRNLGDVAICGGRGEWLIAATSDGSLHSIDMQTGKHNVEKSHPKSLPFAPSRVIGIQEEPKVLVEGRWGVGVWDQSSRHFTKKKELPEGDWQKAWGHLAWRDANGGEMWNIAEQSKLELPYDEHLVI